MNGRSSFGFTIRNHLGELCLAGAVAMSSNCSILKAEAWGLRERVWAACLLSIDYLVIEGNNLVVIDLFSIVGSLAH